MRSRNAKALSAGRSRQLHVTHVAVRGAEGSVCQVRDSGPSVQRADSTESRPGSCPLTAAGNRASAVRAHPATSSLPPGASRCSWPLTQPVHRALLRNWRAALPSVATTSFRLAASLSNEADRGSRLTIHAFQLEAKPVAGIGNRRRDDNLTAGATADLKGHLSGHGRVFGQADFAESSTNLRVGEHVEVGRLLETDTQRGIQRFVVDAVARAVGDMCQHDRVVCRERDRAAATRPEPGRDGGDRRRRQRPLQATVDCAEQRVAPASLARFRGRAACRWRSSIAARDLSRAPWRQRRPVPRNRRIDGFHSRRRRGQNRVLHGDGRFTEERPLAGRHLVEHQARENRSERPSSASRRTCSGDM